MKNYKIVINGTEYEVGVEEIDKDEAVNTPAASPVKSTVKAAPAAGQKITAPIPGTVIQLCFAQGAHVKKGQAVIILESMKMENEIVSPADGIVDFAVSKGATVSAGDLLYTIS